MKLPVRQYFGLKEPTKINYCSNCFNQVEDRCHKAGRCNGASVSSFFRSAFWGENKGSLQRFWIFKITEERERANQKWGLYHGLDYNNFLHPGGFLGSQPYNISFTLNTDGVNKYSSSTSSHLWTCIWWSNSFRMSTDLERNSLFLHISISTNMIQIC